MSLKNKGVVFTFFIAILAIVLAAMGDSRASNPQKYFENVKQSPPLLQAFLRAFPKGGDLHNHLAGAIYAESFINWAAEDNLCVDHKKLALKTPSAGKNCKESGWVDADQFDDDFDALDALVDNISMRSFVPSNGWSGHDQFFSTFGNTQRNLDRLGDMLAETVKRAGAQNISYLELMTSLDIGGLYGIAMQTPWQGSWNDDLNAAYKALMAGPLGQNWQDIIARERANMDAMDARRDVLLGCKSETPDAGCDVAVRYLYQVIRVGPTSGTFAGFMLGFELAKSDPRVVGINLVAPEDNPQALADYGLHMNMIDYLWQTQGAIDISLHAGELAMGLVMPQHMRFHIRDAINIGHAKRIGHGIDVAYEDEPIGLLKQMHTDNILVEINLTSNDVILGVVGKDHPFTLYRLMGVPVALSTDDEGVSRIDLTHEYQRAVLSYDLSYDDIKQLSRNSIEYSFLNAADKAQELAELEAKFTDFEATLNTWPQFKIKQFKIK